MSTFLYEGINQKGEALKGELNAGNKQAALDVLQRDGIAVNSLVQKKGAQFALTFLRTVKNKELVIFLRQFATLLEADIPITRSLTLVANQTENKYFQSILIDVADQVKRGVTLSSAFDKHSEIFGKFFTNIVAVGEISGTMSRSFLYLADYQERSFDLTTKAKRALTYPAFVMVTFLVVMFVMFVTVIPQLSSIFEGSNAEIPTITKAILSVSDLFVNNLYVMVVLFFGSISGAVWYIRTDAGKKVLHSLLLTAPLVGPLFRKLYAARFSDNLSIMLGSGVSMLQALESISGVIGNKVYEEALQKVSEKVRQGRTLSSALEDEPIIGTEIASIVKTGEESGQLSQIMKTIAKFYQQQFSNAVNTMVDLIQPAIIVILAVSVGVLLAAVLLPIYSLTTAI